MKVKVTNGPISSGVNQGENLMSNRFLNKEDQTRILQTIPDKQVHMYVYIKQ